MNPGNFQVAWEIMKWPLVACLILPPLLVYLGLHVVRREVIFVDLALAQVATLGTCVALLLGHHFTDPITFWISLGVTFLPYLQGERTPHRSRTRPPRPPR